MSTYVNAEFCDKIGRLSGSAAYLDYCEALTGYRLPLFNMLDKRQLDYVLQELPVSPEDRVLDLGCGSGCILKRLVESRGCSGTGIDLLPPELMEKSGSALRYVSGNIDRIEEYSLSPTVTLSIDSIYFSRDPAALLRSLCSLPNNRIYLFFSQYLVDSTADRGALRPDRTDVANILNSLSAAYDTVDFSRNEAELYRRSLILLDRLREDFRREGCFDLYEQKYKEQLLGLRLYDTGSAARHLYIKK